MKKLSLTLLTCLLFLSPNVVLSETMKDLVKRDGLYYKKFSDVPFSGVTTGIEQITFKNGKRDGAHIRYYDNGQLWFKGNNKNGERDGASVSYWDNGQLKSKGDLKNGEEEGAWVSYYENGELFSKGNWKNGNREGAFVAYYKDGTVWEKGTGTYKNGNKISY